MNYKIVITGPVGSGKTTAVNSLTDKDAALTDALVSDSDQVTKNRKKTTTVAMDYDVIRLDDDSLVHVYGTPGQERFDFMWEILSKGAHGVILLLDNTRNYPFRDLKYYTQRFEKLIKSSRLVLGITRSDIKQDPPLEAYQHWLKTLKITADVVMIDARNKDDVTNLFYTLLDIPQNKPLSSDKQTQSKDVSPEQSQENTDSKDTIVNTESMRSPSVDNKAASAPVVSNKIEESNAFEIDEQVKFNENTLATVMKVDNVTGTSLSSSMGELLHSTIKDEELNEFIAFLSGIAPDIQNTLNRGKINRIMLRSPHDDNLTVFVEDDQSLGVTSDRRKSVQALSQQIEDMLQWM